jgi:hypothetical protein
MTHLALLERSDAAAGNGEATGSVPAESEAPKEPPKDDTTRITVY